MIVVLTQGDMYVSIRISCRWRKERAKVYPPGSVEAEVIRRARMEVTKLRQKRKEGIAELRRWRRELLKQPVCLPYPSITEAGIVKDMGGLRVFGRRVWIPGFGTCIEIDYDAWHRRDPHPFHYGLVLQAIDAAFGKPIGQLDFFGLEEEVKIGFSRFYPCRHEEFPVTWVDDVVDVEQFCLKIRLSPTECMIVRRCVTSYVILRHCRVGEVIAVMAELVSREPNPIDRSRVLETITRIIKTAIAARRLSR